AAHAGECATPPRARLDLSQRGDAPHTRPRSRGPSIAAPARLEPPSARRYLRARMTALRPGHRVVVTELAEDPAQAIEHMSLEPYDPPDPGQLGPRDVVVEVRSVAVGWVDLLMTSGQYQ